MQRFFRHFETRVLNGTNIRRARLSSLFHSHPFLRHITPRSGPVLSEALTKTVAFSQGSRDVGPTFVPTLYGPLILNGSTRAGDRTQVS